MSRPATLAQVAQAAGVSLGTASNAFNRPEAVRPEVRSAVLAAAEELGYAGPDPVGRMLMGGKANVIAVLPPGDMSVSTAFQSPFFREFMLGISQVCDEHGASLVVLPGSTDRKAWAITNAVVDGFILGHSEEVALVAGRRRKVPCVVMDMDAGPDVPTVAIAARDGARQAAAHLLSLGHRRFAIISVARRPRPPVLHRLSEISHLSAGYPLDEEKLAGYREALWRRVSRSTLSSSERSTPIHPGGRRVRRQSLMQPPTRRASSPCRTGTRPPFSRSQLRVGATCRSICRSSGSTTRQRRPSARLHSPRSLNRSSKRGSARQGFSLTRIGKSCFRW
jgi:hypothetical protein